MDFEQKVRPEKGGFRQKVRPEKECKEWDADMVPGKLFEVSYLPVMPDKYQEEIIIQKSVAVS